MKAFGVATYALHGGVAVALLAGCGALRQPFDFQPPIAASGSPSNTLVGKDQSLLYVSDEPDGDVYMVVLPSGRLVGRLTGFDYASGDCIDQYGNVFVGNLAGAQVRAYAHGAKSAFRVLSDPNREPNACSVDPTTGNLAVANLRSGQSEGSVAVYQGAKGAARYYEYSGVLNFWYCAYDSDGNLFVDAIIYGSKGGSDNPVVLELPKGRSNLEPISLSPALTGNVSPPLLWDGKYLAIASPSSGAIYQYKISGRSGTRIGVVKLDDVSEVSGSFWITSNGGAQTLYAPIVEDSIQGVGVYHYPAGGKRLRYLYDAPLPFAAAVSPPK